MRERYVVMYHGVIAEGRGLFAAVDAFHKAVARRPKLLLVLLGDGAQLGRVRERIAQLDLLNDSLILPPVIYEDVRQFVSAADLGYMVYPDIRYWDYNHPIKVAEYLSEGVPVLCSKIPMFLENYAGCEAMVYSDASTPEAVAESIIWCYDHPDDMRAKALAARSYAADLTWSRQAHRLAAFLETLQSEDSSSHSHPRC
jgi:glycosyltransferase involved in cell wall biosynthesis